MRKAKSRNFILIVCGVFLFFILSFAFVTFFVKSFSSLKDDKQDKLADNFWVSSTKIELVGNGNFVNEAPKVMGTKISDFYVVLESFSDKVSYSLNVCNNNLEDVYIVSKPVNFICSNELGQSISCQDVEVNSYIYNGDRTIGSNMFVPANSCFDFLIEAEYIGYKQKQTQIYIDEYEFNIK